MKTIKCDTKVEMRSFTRPTMLKCAVYEDVSMRAFTFALLIFIASLFLSLFLSRYRYKRLDSSHVHVGPYEI